MYKCGYGEEYLNEDGLDQHKTKYNNRHLSCELCNESFSTSQQMRDHLYLCGNKTTKCSRCQRYIRRGVYVFHLDNNCQDLDEDNTNYKQDRSTFNRGRTNENESYHRQSIEKNNGNQFQQERDYQKQTNQREIDHQECIPCEFCHQQIPSFNYNHHIRFCSQTPNRRREDSAQSINNRTTYEQERKPRSNISEKYNSNSYDDSSRSSNNQSDILTSSFERIELNNFSSNDKSVSREGAVSLLREKTSSIQDALNPNYYTSEINHVVEKLQFNILIVGAPRVGKSQLINALCNGKNLAKTSPSLNSCTKEVTCYVLEDNQQQTPGVKPFKINFYDTPGIESWINEGGQTTMLKFIEEKDPICVIYCASPGSFADLKQVHPVLEFCEGKQIFCALVCTNMWSNSNRKEVIQEFEKQLNFFGDRVERWFNRINDQSGHKVTFFGNGALCTMVNSTEYYDPDFSPERKPVQGIDELIHSIMESLDNEKLLGWCNAVLYRRSYWEKITQKIDGFYSTHVENLYHLTGMTIEQIAVNVSIYFSGMINRTK